jgi:hypothetical protein
MTETNNKICSYCNGKGFLDQKGIAKVYLFPHKIPLILILAGLLGWIFYSKYALIVCVAGYIIPLAGADLRLLLYPFVALKKLLGKKVECPNC